MLGKRTTDLAIAPAICSNGGADQGADYGRNRMPTSSQPTDDLTDIALASFAEVQQRTMEWLWPNWVPLGKLAILDGDPGLGKSTLLFDLAARVSNDGIMPDGLQGAAGSVIILNAEDDPEDTIKPRLLAAGAKAERVFHLSEVGAGGGRRPVRIPGDLALIGRHIEHCSARLLIVDPLPAFLSGVDVNRDQDIRQVLLQISDIAHQMRCAVICVRHLNKGSSSNAVYRGCGSIGLIGHARTGLVVAQAPDADAQRILAVSKCNTAVRPVSLRFALEGQDVACRIRWLGPAPYRANELVDRPPSAAERERGQTDRACQEYIRRLVGSCGMPVQSVKTECADAGFSLRTNIISTHKT
jgi:hypothetical protein